MNRIKPVLCLVGVLMPLLGISPAYAAKAPEPFSLGAPVANPSALPAAPVSKPAAKGVVKAAAAGPEKTASKRTKPVSKVAAKTKARKSAEVIATDVPPAKLDLTLPKDMVSQLQPPGKEAAETGVHNAAAADDAKPILPSLFAPKTAGEPFQLNGRLLTNEMDLQLRNDARREVEGAALDFKFRQ